MVRCNGYEVLISSNRFQLPVSCNGYQMVKSFTFDQTLTVILYYRHRHGYGCLAVKITDGHFQKRQLQLDLWSLYRISYWIA